jgi:hypothetical protein
MAQPPQPPPKPQTPPPQQPPPLRDPAAGKPPAVGGGHVTTQEERDRDHDKGRGPSGYRPPIGVKGEPIEDSERDPDTIAEEQRIRSADMEAKGVNKWKEEHDERPLEERGAQPRLEGHEKAR